MRRLTWICLALLLMASAGRAGTLQDIRASGVVTCGLDPARPGFSVRTDDYSWSGLDVDLCRAIAAAVLGEGQKVNLVALAENDRIVALQSGEIDILLHGLAWTDGIDAKNGLMFVAPTFDGNLGGERVVYGPLVRQGDDQWFHVIRSVLMTLVQSSQTPDPELDRALQLDAGWKDRALAIAGSYAANFPRHFGPETEFKLPEQLPFAPP
jgi:hypothetical protein